MIPFFDYILQTQVCLTFFYILYLLFLHRKIAFRFSRIYLLLAVPLSCLMPLIKIPIGMPSGTGLTAVPSEGFYKEFLVTASLPENIHENIIISVLAAVYTAGVIISLGMLFFNILKFVRMAGRGEKVRIGGKEIIISGEKNGAFSVFGKIVIARGDLFRQDLDQILKHERWHGKLGHSADNLIMFVQKSFLWFNPVVWHLEALLKEIHEYQVDEHMIRSGTDPVRYTRLLIDYEMGMPGPYIAPTFGYISVRNRIKMIARRNGRKKNKRLFWILPAAGTYLFLFCLVPSGAGSAAEPGNAPVKYSGALSLSSAVENENKEADESAAGSDEETVPFAIVEEKPSFRGGDQNDFTRWVYTNITYPATAKKKKIQGRVMLSFVIGKSGEMKNARVIRGADKILDEEALRVVKSSPRWEPGKMNGKVVNTRFTFPIIFQLR